MFTITGSFSGFSVNNIDEAKEFYGQILGLTLNDEVGGTTIALPNGARAWMYVKADHQAAAYTMLNLVVGNIDAAVDELLQRGVAFEHYPNSWQDDKGIMRGKEHSMGPNIAWFKDPAGNILAVVEL